MAGIFENYSDLFVRPGTTGQFFHEITPLDATGCTANLVIDGIATFAVTIAVVYVGSNPYSTFQVTIPSTTTAAWVPGVYDFRLTITFSDGEIFDALDGILMVKRVIPLV